MQKEIEITSGGNVSPFAIAVAQALTALTLAAYKAVLYFCKNKQPYAKDAKDR